MLRNYKDVITVILGVITVAGCFVFAVKVKGEVAELNIFDSLGKVAVSFYDKATEEKAVDFGSVSFLGKDYRHNFELKNKSEKPLVISGVYTSCECTDAYMTIGDKKFGPFGLSDYFYSKKGEMTVAPGQNYSVEVKFSPSLGGLLGVGSIEHFASILGEEGQKILLRMNALVFP